MSRTDRFINRLINICNRRLVAHLSKDRDTNLTIIILGTKPSFILRIFMSLMIQSSQNAYEFYIKHYFFVIK
jgi:hypothetical protein